MYLANDRLVLGHGGMGAGGEIPGVGRELDLSGDNDVKHAYLRRNSMAEK